MNKTHTGHVFTLANKITIVRILLVPVFILLVIYYLLGLVRGESVEMLRWMALVVFSAAALSDALDGYVARSRNEVTRLGRILDPIADKSLLLSALILLTRPSMMELEPHIPVWFTLLVVARDVIIILGSFLVHAMTGLLDVRPHMTGKIATFLQMVAVVWVLIGISSKWFYYLCIMAASIMAFVSGVVYVLDGLRQIENAHEAHKGSPVKHD